MAPTIYPFLLQQIAAESYLDGETATGLPVWQAAGGIRDDRLRLGSNNYSVPEFRVNPAAPDLPGKTRMTDAQITEFNARFDIVDHLPNTQSGFSATLMRDRITGEYTLAFRSTEYADDADGGDWSRDGPSGAASEIAGHGFAVAQIADAEAYFRSLRADPTKLPIGAPGFGSDAQTLHPFSGLQEGYVKLA